MSKDTDRLERQLEEDRAEIGQTIESIKQRLTPGELLDQAMVYMRSGGVDMGASVARSVKDNPLPLLLTGVGLTWLIASSSASSADRHGQEESLEHYVARSNAAERARAEAAAAKRQEDESETQFQERLTDIKAKALSVTRRAEETAASFRQRVEDALHQAETAAADMRHRAADMRHRATAYAGSGADAMSAQGEAMKARAKSAQSSMVDLYHSQPLVAVALGVAAGAAISALLPSTSTERRLTGEYGDRVRAQAKNIASTTAEGVKSAAEEGSRAAAEAAEDELRVRSRA